MLLQVVGASGAHTAHTSFQKNRRPEGEACSLSRCACSSHGGCLTQQRRSSNGPTYACGQPPYHCLNRTRFPSSHTAMLSKRIVSVAAMKQDTAPQDEMAVASNPSAEFKGPESGDPNFSKRCGQVDSVASGSKKLTERFTDLKSWWKALNDAYQEDSATWGYGSSPIFTVYLRQNGQIGRVSIDEEEIERRQVADFFIPGVDNEGNKEQAQKKIILARSIAKDLEIGKREFNRHSAVFKVVQHSSKDTNQSGRQKLLKQIDIAVHRAAPVLKWTLIIAIPLYGFSILFGAYLLVTKRSESDLNNAEKSADRLEKMRNLKAQMNTRKENTNIEQPSLAPSEFMQKFFEVREMARKVRLEEGVQNSVKEADTFVEDYQPEVPGSLSVSTISLDSKSSIEHEGDSDTDVEEYQPEVEGLSNRTGGKFNQSTLDNVDVTGANMTVTLKPTRKLRPRIITSLDEAMSVLGSKRMEDVETAQRVLCEGEPQIDHKLNNASKLHEEIIQSNDLDSMLIESGSCGESFQMEADRIVDINSGGQDRVKETQSEQRHEGEVPSSELDLSFDQHDIEPKGQSTKSHASENKQLDKSRNDYMHHSKEVSAEVLSSASSAKVRTRDSVRKSVLDMETDEVVGSGQPLRKTVGSVQSVRPGPIFSSTKQWSRELQRKYDFERDPEIRDLMKEIGSELDSWVTEEEIEETARLAEKLEEGDEEYLRKNFTRVQKKIKEEKEKFGLDAVFEKYKEYQPKPADELWWLDLRCVMCLMVANEEGKGLYGLDMTIDDKGSRGQEARHVIAFEDRKDASNFCRLLELRSSSRFQVAEVRPFSPKKLLVVSKEEGLQVTVLRCGQIQTHVDQSLEEVEDKILEIGKSVYWDKLDREHSIDIDSILHQRFGL